MNARNASGEPLLVGFRYGKKTATPVVLTIKSRHKSHTGSVTAIATDEKGRKYYATVRLYKKKSGFCFVCIGNARIEQIYTKIWWL